MLIAKVLGVGVARTSLRDAARTTKLLRLRSGQAQYKSVTIAGIALGLKNTGLTQNYEKTNRKERKGYVRAASRREGKKVSESYCVSPKIIKREILIFRWFLTTFVAIKSNLDAFALDV